MDEFESIIYLYRYTNIVGGPTNGFRKVWRTLGPVLTLKLDILAPFVDEEGHVVIPGDLEQLDANERRMLRRRSRRFFERN
jgi:hypothetical protein